jgi:hypothetical protein
MIKIESSWPSLPRTRVDLEQRTGRTTAATGSNVLDLAPTQAEAIRIAADRYRASRWKWWRRWLLRVWVNR